MSEDGDSISIKPKAPSKQKRPPLALKLNHSVTQKTLPVPPPDQSQNKDPSDYILLPKSHSNLFNKRNKHSRSARQIPTTQPPVHTPKPRSAREFVSQVLPKQQQTHLFKTYKALNFVMSLQQPLSSALIEKKVYLPKLPPHKKTVVLDLDETLVHCVPDPKAGEVPITVEFPNGDIVQAGINIRPFARELLQTISKHYEVIVFTASHKLYADQVINYLDPEGEYVNHRLYRDHCYNADGIFVKDLRVLANRDLDNVLLVDNAVYSFAFQLDNGIPVGSWYKDPADKELERLQKYLMMLLKYSNLVKVNKKVFKLQQFYSEYEEGINKENTGVH